MLKLYKRQDDGSLAYHEAWVNGDVVVSHKGIAGERGETNKSKRPRDAADELEVLTTVLQDSMNRGFRPLDDDEWRILIIEYELQSSWGDPIDLEKRHEIQDRMDQTLGWTGLGNCDGGSTGSGSMEVCCFVADFEIARCVIECDLVDTDFADFTRIYDESE